MAPTVHPDHLRAPPHGLAHGYNPISDASDDRALGITFGIWKLDPGERVEVTTAGLETALLALEGRGALWLNGTPTAFARAGWLEQGPTTVHAPAGSRLEIVAEDRCEVARVQTPNAELFPARAIPASEVATEHRGKGKLDDTAYRLVRTVFDRRSAPAAARLVLGEVITLPGRWSSYPPHHHPQPELYYYRFHPEQGYGHAEAGERVYLVRQHDALRILDNQDHAQAAAPGYHMYYLWAIRHLDGAPYEGFEYTETHRWTFD